MNVENRADSSEEKPTYKKMSDELKPLTEKCWQLFTVFRFISLPESDS